jgi:hypothetical protein
MSRLGARNGKYFLKNRKLDRLYRPLLSQYPVMDEVRRMNAVDRVIDQLLRLRR